MASIWTSDAQAAQQGFDESYYLSAKAALLTSQTGSTWTVDMVKASFASAGLQAYEHYQQYGFKEGLNPNAYFNNSYYNSSKAAASGSTESAFQTAWNNVNGGSQTSTYFHYLQYGFNEAGVNPSATFNEAQYYTDKAALLTAQTGQTWTVAQVQAAFASAGLTPITHYMLYGGTSNEPTPQPVQVGAYNLTVNPDVATANVFDSAQAWSTGGDVLVNTLQNFDKLTGTGTNPTLNVQLGDASAGSGTTITPTLTGIQTINAAFIGSTGATPATPPVTTLDMQDATGATSLNITRISDGNAAAFTNIASVPTTLSLSNTNSPANAVTFRMLDSAVSGDADTTTLTLNNASVGTLTVQGTTAGTIEGHGVETVNLVSSTSANAITNVLNVDDIKVLNISGNQDLKINDINYGVADGDFSAINGSQATGNLTLTIDDDVVGGAPGLNSAMRATTGTGAPVAFNLSTGSGNDILKVTATAQVIGTTNDTIDLGTGTDTVAFSLAGNALTNANGVFTDATSAVFNGVERVTLTRTTDQAAVGTAATLTLDSSRLSGDQAFTLTNSGDANDGLVNLILNNLSATEAASNITLKHSSTGNNDLGDTLVQASTTGDTLGITIANGTNSDPLFNFQLKANAASINNVTLTDTDTESNTVRLMDENSKFGPTVSGLTGTITVTGGQAGQYMNLDATATVAGNANSVGGYGYTMNGLPLNTALGGYSSLTAAVADTQTSNVSLVNQVAATDSAVASALSSGITIAANQLITASTITATGAASDVIVRVGQANQTINLGTGNDTVIFADRTGTTAATSGLTVADTVSGGAGSDTIVLDGTGAMSLTDSEWTNLSGIDTIRLAGVTGSTLNLTLSNKLIDQTDSGSVLNIINNDGNLTTNAENAATIDLRNLNAENFVNFVGANGDGTNVLNVQRVLVNDVTANGNNHFNGGDADVVLTYVADATTTFANQAAADAAWYTNVAAGTDGNANIYSAYAMGSTDTTTITVGDLANTKNFSTLEFHNEQASAKTLALTLDSATVDQLVDASHTASTTQVETLNITAFDNTLVPGANAILKIDASTVGAQFSLNITGGAGADTITAGAGADTLVGNAGNDTINGGIGADSLTGGLGADTFAVGNGLALTTVAEALAQTTTSGVISAGNVEVMHDFSIAQGDHISFVAAGQQFDFNTGVAGIQASAALGAINTGVANGVSVFAGDNAAVAALGATAADTVLLIDTNGAGAGTLAGSEGAIVLTGVNAAALLVSGDIII